MAYENKNTSSTESSGGDGLALNPVIYIGKHLEKPIWYFVSIKDGFCRFLHFGFSPLYPFWMAGLNTGKSPIYSVPDKLSPSSCPKEVWDEVNLFVQGKVIYVPVPSKKGRKASVTRICQEDGGLSPTSVQPGVQERESGRLDVPPTTKHQEGTDPVVQGSRCSTSGSIVEVSVGAGASKSKRRRGNGIAGPNGSKPQPSGVPSGEVTPHVRKRGRPAKLPELVVAVSDSNRKEIRPETQKASQTTMANMPTPVQEQQEEPVVKRGRGRPPKARPLVVMEEDKIQGSKVSVGKRTSKKKQLIREDTSCTVEITTLLTGIASAFNK